MMNILSTFQLNKSIWTEEDFDTMGWHDSPIYGISFGDNFEFLLDIDYIFKWLETGEGYRFLISPCTLVFENVHDINIEIRESYSRLEIDNIYRENPQRPKNGDFIKRDTEFEWLIETQQGTISFKSVGYKQFVRQALRLIESQVIGVDARGGISFAKQVI
jgi:hypothetical protein